MSLPDHFPLKAAQGKTILIPSVGYGTWASGDSSASEHNVDHEAHPLYQAPRPGVGMPPWLRSRLAIDILTVHGCMAYGSIDTNASSTLATDACKGR